MIGALMIERYGQRYSMLRGHEEMIGALIIDKQIS